MVNSELIINEIVDMQLQGVKIAKDTLNFLRVEFEKFCKSTELLIPNDSFFKIRRLWKKIEKELESDNEQVDIFKKNIYNKVNDVFKKYADLDDSGELKRDDSGNLIYSILDNKEKAEEELKIINIDAVEGGKNIEKQFLQNIVFEMTEWFNEKEIPNELSNAAKNILLDYFCK